MVRRSLSAKALVPVGTAVVCAVLAFNMVSFGSRGQGRRYWIDTMVAVKIYLDSAKEPPGELPPPSLEQAFEAPERVIARLSKGIPRAQFWRVLPARTFMGNYGSAAASPSYEDPGRSLLLGLGFRLLDGVAPHLLSWLGILAAVPVLAWSMAELAGGGRPVAAMLFGLLSACSPYVVQSLSLGYSPFGFYLVSLVSLVALSAYVGFAAGVTARGLLLRFFAGGVVFAICLACRGGTLLLAPGFMLALLVGSRRLPDGGRARALTTLGALLLFALPALTTRSEEHHAVWPGFWEGLGDFDRSKEYYWNDLEALRILERSGLPATWVDLNGADAEAFFRNRVLRDVAADPGWYASILVRRLSATLLQSKLWPWEPRDGVPFAEATSPHEGRIDEYYRFTRTVDFIGFGGWQWELPVMLLLAPTGLLLAVGLTAQGLGLPTSRVVRLRRDLIFMGAPSLAALGAPLLITTASALETQAFGLVHLLAWSLGLDELLRVWWNRARPLDLHLERSEAVGHA